MYFDTSNDQKYFKKTDRNMDPQSRWSIFFFELLNFKYYYNEQFTDLKPFLRKFCLHIFQKILFAMNKIKCLILFSANNIFSTSGNIQQTLAGTPSHSHPDTLEVVWQASIKKSVLELG